MADAPTAAYRGTPSLPATHEPPQPDVAEHERTFEIFVKAAMIFGAHVMVILGLLALFAY